MAMKQYLQSAGDGTAVPTGYIGEVKPTPTFSNFATTTAATEVLATSANAAAKITLEAGTWQIFFGGCISFESGSGVTSSTVNGRLRLYSITNAGPVGSGAIFLGEIMGASQTQYRWVFSSVISTFTETREYTLGLICNRTSGTSGAFLTFRSDDLGQFSGSDNSAILYAVRLA